MNWEEKERRVVERMAALRESVEDMRAGRVIPAETLLAEMRQILAKTKGR